MLLTIDRYVQTTSFKPEKNILTENIKTEFSSLCDETPALKKNVIAKMLVFTVQEIRKFSFID